MLLHIVLPKVWALIRFWAKVSLATFAVVATLASIAASSLAVGQSQGYIDKNPIEVFFETPAQLTEFLTLGIEALEIYIGQNS